MNRIKTEILARVVKDKREKLNLSQNDLAVRTGIHRAMISKIENGSHMPSITQL